ncbi:hypothetical protein MUGA111182_20685 [Mucilaginibacter galii]|uniref:hypothetical protein n=1 Tax=Mucilaginibacter galii TaxID=2005073 RepID=UPI003632190F
MRLNLLCPLIAGDGLIRLISERFVKPLPALPREGIEKTKSFESQSICFKEEMVKEAWARHGTRPGVGL